MTTKTINIFSKYGNIIGIRRLAESIFDDIDEANTEIIVDFDKVEFIGRSFTQEYIRQKKKQTATVKEVNLSDDNQKMMDWVIRTWK